MDPHKEALIRSLHELQYSIRKENKKNIKSIINCFYQNLARNKQILSELYKSGTRCPTQTDLILAACQNKKADILYYIIKETDILVHLTHESFDETEVNKQRTEAIKHALSLEDFNKVEMLYDFWCGNLHWSGHNTENIKMVGNVLENAREASPSVLYCMLTFFCSDYDDQLRANLHCLLTFNAFQREIYTELARLDSSAITLKETGTTLLKVLRIYDEYSHIEKIRRKHTKQEQELAIKANINDGSSTFYKNLEYIYYEVYFRKLDFNVSLLILENLFVLRKHLKARFNKEKKYFNDNPNMRILYKDAANTYEEIESAIYHFIYSTGEHWQWYLPKNRQIRKEEHNVFNEGGEKTMTLTVDLHKLYNGPVLYLERESFKECFEKLKIILEEYVIRDDPDIRNDPALNDKPKVDILLNENYLGTVGYMRDHYSLIKIVYYIEAIEKATDINVVIVERVLHVVGEMVKSTDASKHLSRATQALLQTAISVETINHLQNIRNFLSHTREGQLSTRIHMADTEAHRFEEIKEELITLSEIIKYPILDIVKTILYKSLLEKGLRLLEQRIEGLPDEVKDLVDDIYRLYEINKNELVLESGNYYQDVWRHTGLTLQLLKEIPWVMQNKAKILRDIQLAKTDLSEKIVEILPSLLPYARPILKLIIESIETINQYDQSVQMSKYPDAKEITEIRKKLKKLMKKNQCLKNIVDLTLLNKLENYIDHWESVKGMLSECELFAAKKHRLTDTPTVTEADLILKELEAIICVKENSNLACNSLILNKKDFTGIEGLHKDLIDSKKISVAPRLAREKLFIGLISRLDLLIETMFYPQHLSQLVRRYDHDVKFRITIEMILADIANVLVECNIRLMNKPSKLLRYIDLSHVLDHGNPFLEVIGDIFNSHDLAAEWLDKAIMFAEDAKSIKALYKLFKGEIEYQSISTGDLDKMDDQQKQLYEQFLESRNWESYASLTAF